METGRDLSTKALSGNLGGLKNLDILVNQPLSDSPRRKYPNNGSLLQPREDQPRLREGHFNVKKILPSYGRAFSNFRILEYVDEEVTSRPNQDRQSP
jgi:hypothetical protein